MKKNFLKNLTIKEWEILERHVAMADYWGLKPHNARLGLDGSSWQIDAYAKQPKYSTRQKTHSVYRWSRYNSFAELGRIFMKLSGEKDLCGGF